eukprot:Rhum_TRINITY_DN13975_c0_g1::Rhum_TRINITY_DN13975_c0_g1_i4::g.66878::m.66878
MLSAHFFAVGSVFTRPVVKRIPASSILATLAGFAANVPVVRVVALSRWRVAAVRESAHFVRAVHITTGPNLEPCGVTQLDAVSEGSNAHEFFVHNCVDIAALLSLRSTQRTLVVVRAVVSQDATIPEVTRAVLTPLRLGRRKSGVLPRQTSLSTKRIAGAIADLTHPSHVNVALVVARLSSSCANCTPFPNFTIVGGIATVAKSASTVVTVPDRGSEKSCRQTCFLTNRSALGNGNATGPLFVHFRDQVPDHFRDIVAADLSGLLANFRALDDIAVRGCSATVAEGAGTVLADQQCSDGGMISGQSGFFAHSPTLTTCDRALPNHVDCRSIISAQLSRLAANSVTFRNLAVSLGIAAVAERARAVVTLLQPVGSDRFGRGKSSLFAHGVALNEGELTHPHSIDNRGCVVNALLSSLPAHLRTLRDVAVVQSITAVAQRARTVL